MLLSQETFGGQHVEGLRADAIIRAAPALDLGAAGILDIFDAAADDACSRSRLAVRTFSKL